MEVAEIFVLETSRLILRDYQEEDTEAVHAFRSDPLVARYWTGRPDTPEDTHAFITRVRESARQQHRTQYRLAVSLRETGAVIGGCALYGMTDPSLREGGVGFYLHRLFWSKGYATEIGSALLRLGFGCLNLHRIYGDCAPENVASAQVMRKIGMRQEGHQRENYWTGNEWQDSLLFAILDHEWKAQQA
jgi:ribosomal-protein-alanine N-acetyltransferase